MALTLRPAERKKAKLRIGLSGPSGSGKSIGALRIARGLASEWSKIAVIDSENGSGDLYSHLGAYNVLTIESPFSPEKYIEAIQACEQGGMEVIIIDSVTHEWDGKGGCLEINEAIAKSKFKGNTWSAWSETTPRHQRFIEAITTSKCHVITTARSKTDTIQTEDKKIKKVGLKDIQREGYEYELTVAFNIDRDGHNTIASKDRTGIFSERDPFLITEEIGQELAKWNDSGIDPAIEQNRLFDEVSRKIADSETIQDLKEVFDSAKNSKDAMGVDLFAQLIELKDLKKEFLQSQEEEHHEQPEDEPGAGDIAAKEESN